MSKAEVFIVESLKFDEEQDYKEGEMIYRSLRMSGKNPIYRYIRTEDELVHFVDEFEDSEYRYLHVSCHGNRHGIATTLSDISTEKFAEIVGPALDQRRLFLSTCQATTIQMANSIFAQGRCTSVAGPVSKICFDDSVILWTSFYHLMFKADAKQMKRSQIKATLAKCGLMVSEKLNLFTPSSSENRGAIRVVLPAKHPTLT